MTSAAPGTPSPAPGPPGPDIGPWRAPVPWEPADGHTGRAAYLAAPTSSAAAAAAAKRPATGAPARGSARARRAPAAVPAPEEVAAPGAQQLRDRPGAVLLAAACECGWVGPTAALPSPPRPVRAPQRSAKASRRGRRRQGATPSGAGDTGGAGGGVGAGELAERDQAWCAERDQAAAATATAWRAHLDQEVPSLEVAVAIAERDATIAAAHARVDEVVRRARNRDDPVTWTLIGKAEGITRAGAFNRWGAKQ